MPSPSVVCNASAILTSNLVHPSHDFEAAGPEFARRSGQASELSASAADEDHDSHLESNSAADEDDDSHVESENYSVDNHDEVEYGSMDRDD